MTGPSQWIERYAAIDPGRACLRLNDQTKSYHEVLAAVQAWAGWLYNEHHVEPGAVVWIKTPSPLHQRLLRWAAGLLGAIEAVVDPRLAATETESRARRLNPAVRLESFPHETPPQLHLDIPNTAAAMGGRLLFSSGTSGQPHAALFDAAGLASAARSNISTRGLSKTDTLLCALPCFHAAGSLFEDSILHAGGTLHLIENGGCDTLLEAIATGHPTIVSLAPTQLRQLARVADGRSIWGNLRLVNYAGEPIDDRTLRWLLQSFAGRVTRGYGTTEAGPLISVLGDAEHRRRLPDPRCLGRPAAGVECRIDDDGVLRVRSAHLMLGYIGDPSATAERLVDGWLVTGDLFDIVDGQLMLRGRANSAIRSGAEWVFPSEVERAVAAIDGVVEVAVIAVPSPTWGERPVAFVSCSGPLDTDAVHDQLAQRLAPFKWPDWIEPLAELPRTGTNKTDRAALKERAANGPSNHAIVLRDAEKNTD